MHQLHVLVAFLSVIHASHSILEGDLSISPELHGHSRLLKQENSRERIVTDESDLYRRVRRADPGETIVIDIANVQLTETLTIDVSYISIRGRGMNETVVRCPEQQIPAFSIQGNHASIEALTFSNCDGDSAVVVEADQTQSDEIMRVVFHLVRFLNNGQRRQATTGGGLRIQTCSENDCLQPIVQIISCRFEKNRAVFGGSIFANNSDMRIRHSVFQDNEAALAGGAIYIGGGRPVLRIELSSFERNNATNGSYTDEDPAVQALTNDWIAGKGATGGAVFIKTPQRFTVRDSNFENNAACVAGGSLSLLNISPQEELLDPVNATIQNSNFSRNEVFCLEVRLGQRQDEFGELLLSGGALFTQSQNQITGNVLVENCKFSENSAENGGAVQVESGPRLTHAFQSCSFRNNHGFSAGGGLYARNTRILISGTSFVGNRAILSGGLCTGPDVTLICGPSSDTGVRTVFEDNIGLHGGAVQGNIRFRAILEGVSFTNNTAIRYAGALRIFNTMFPVIIRGCLFDNNRALMGGALSLFAVANLTIESFNGEKTVFRNNQAFMAAGMDYTHGLLLFIRVNIMDTEFINNTASDWFGPQAERRVERALNDEFFISRIFDVADAPYPANATMRDMFNDIRRLPIGYGGGFCMTLGEPLRFDIVEVLFKNVLMMGNEAIAAGGGGCIDLGKAFWNVEPRLHCFPARFGADSCQKVIFENVNITDNTARYGGGLFVTRPGSVMLTCDRDRKGPKSTLLDVMRSRLHNPDNHLDFENDLLCTDIHSNKISDGVHEEGADVGSNAASLFLANLTGPLKTVASGEQLMPPCNGADDHDCPASLTVLVKDAFNQTIRRGIADAELELTVSAENVTGDLRYTARNGTAEITSTSAWGINISSELTIQATYNSSMEVKVNFSTRPCRIGEQITDNRCTSCPPDQFGFTPSKNSCISCPPEAKCRGGPALVPVDGHWHSTPFSPQFHRCFIEGACTYEKRVENLTEFYQKPEELQRELEDLTDYLKNEGKKPEFTSYTQCSEGYEGVLCGSCKPGYGHSLSGECEACPNGRRLALISGALSFLWVFFAVGINAAITLLSASARIQLVRGELKKKSTRTKKPTLRRLTSHIRPDVVMETVETARAIRSSTSILIEDPQAKQLLDKRLIATVQFTESLKILLNYLQVTSAALRLQVEWKSLMSGFLSVQSVFVGVTSEAISAPSECYFDNTGVKHPSVAALWLRVVTPSLVLCALIIVFSFFWVFINSSFWTGNRNRTRAHFSKSWVTGVIVIALVTVYFSYIDVTREFFRTINCIKVDREGESGRLYQQYAIETNSHVWVEDTNLMCFEGVHTKTGIAGICALAVSFLFFLFIIIWLPLNKHNRANPDFIARYWFLYQAYRREWYTSCWEAAILTRKALIAATIVFAAHLGPTLQSSLCVGTLILALMLQTIFSPFIVEEEHTNVPDYFGRLFRFVRLSKLASAWLEMCNSMTLNSLECASLFSSIAVFFTAVLLNDPHTSQCGEYAMIIFAFVLNLLFVMYMFYRLYTGVHLITDYKLEFSDPAYMATKPNGPGLRSLIRKGWHVMAIIYADHKIKRIGGEQPIELHTFRQTLSSSRKDIGATKQSTSA